MDSMPLKKEQLIVFLLAGIQFVHILDFVIIMPLGPVLMQEFSIGPTRFGTLVSSYNYAAAIAAILLSTVADRFNRKYLLLISLFGFFASCLWCAGARSYSELLTARIITGAFGGALNALVFTLVTDLVPYERRGRAMGVLASSFSVASVAGIPSGLLLADLFGWSSTFLYSASFGLIIFIFSVFLIPNGQKQISTSSSWEKLHDYGRALVNPHYLKAHFFMLIVSMSMFVLIPFLSPYAVNNMGILTTELKYMYFVAGICTIISARYFGRLTDTQGASSMFMLLAFLSIIPVLWYSHAGPMGLVTYLILGSLFMSLVSGRMIPCMTLLTAVPKDEERGSFMSVLNAVRSFGTATATLISGAIITQAPNGQLENYSQVGMLSVVMILLTIALTKILSTPTRTLPYAATP
jgi:MFS transporter, DHA1 family, inner membrane transport protein